MRGLEEYEGWTSAGAEGVQVLKERGGGSAGEEVRGWRSSMVGVRGLKSEEAG